MDAPVKIDCLVTVLWSTDTSWIINKNMKIKQKKLHLTLDQCSPSQKCNSKLTVIHTSSERSKLWKKRSVFNQVQTRLMMQCTVSVVHSLNANFQILILLNRLQLVSLTLTSNKEILLLQPIFILDQIYCQIKQSVGNVLYTVRDFSFVSQISDNDFDGKLVQRWKETICMFYLNPFSWRALW